MSRNNRSRVARYSQNNKLPDIAKANEMLITAKRPSYAGVLRTAALLDEVAFSNRTMLAEETQERHQRTVGDERKGKLERDSG